MVVTGTCGSGLRALSGMGAVQGLQQAAAPQIPLEGAGTPPWRSVSRDGLSQTCPCARGGMGWWVVRDGDGTGVQADGLGRDFLLPLRNVVV